MQHHSASETGQPLQLAEVLADEYDALRPRGHWRGRTEPEAFTEIHASDEPLSALCISGGGIRSATFGLGAIQGLAKHGTEERSLLERFDYLSTVSGGGYIGSWLTAWKDRAEKASGARDGGLRAIVPRLRPDAPKAADGEVDPVQHLREYNNYLSPRAGGLSSDMWTLLSTVIRNILLNWTVLIPLLMSILMFPRLLLTLLAFPENRQDNLLENPAIIPPGCDPDVKRESKPTYYCAEALNGISHSEWVKVVLVASCVLFVIALFNTLRYLPGIGNVPHDRFDHQRNVLAPLVAAIVAFMVFDSLFYLGDQSGAEELWHIMVTMSVLCALAWLLFLVVGIGPWVEARTKQRGWRRVVKPNLPDRLRKVLSPLSLAIGAMAFGAGFVTWLSTNELLWSADDPDKLSWAAWVTIWPPVVLLGFVLSTVLFVGVSSAVLRDDDREWMSRSMAASLLFCVSWVAICGLVLVVPKWLLRWHEWGHWVVGALLPLAAWISTRTSAAGDDGETEGTAGPKKSRVASMGLKIGPILFFLLLMVSLSIITNFVLILAHRVTNTDLRAIARPERPKVAWYDHELILTRSEPWLVVVVAVAFLAIALMTSYFININTFSLHAMYRDRIVRAYLGASTPDRKRNANYFTEFSHSDDFSMGSLHPESKPFHVVNLTLNLVGGSRLEWQQRKADSFTVTPLHVGNATLGYRPASEYAQDRKIGEDGDPDRAGITLGTAVALSGAAASPNMGAFSSPAVGFIMTLFNTRLGAWLGNPGEPQSNPDGSDEKVGEKKKASTAWKNSGPRFALGPMLMEALNKTSSKSEYVYLSDGGHFDNLGLYEMARRRCRYIIVLDSSNDPNSKFKELGNAMRKIRIDLGIPIDFDEGHLQAICDRRRRSALGTIRYSDVDLSPGGEQTEIDGRIIYIKPVLVGNETPDVTSYAALHATFPHESTADQMFDESQTESYRLLGLNTIDELCQGWDGESLASLCEHLASVDVATPKNA